MSPAELSQLDALRRIVENLSDDAIRAFVDTIIRAILHGLADELADRMVDALVTQLAAAGGPGQGGGNDQGEGAEPSSGTTPHAPPGGQDTTAPAETGVASGPIKLLFRNNIQPNETCASAPKTKRKRSPAQDSVSHTCEICGRTGTRRYVETATGWRCSPTATKCPGNRVFPPPPSTPPTQAAQTVKPEKPSDQRQLDDCNKVGEISTPNVALARPLKHTNRARQGRQGRPAGLHRALPGLHPHLDPHRPRPPDGRRHPRTEARPHRQHRRRRR